MEVRQCSRVDCLKRRAKAEEEEKEGDRWRAGMGVEKDRQERLLASHRASRCHPPPQYRSDVCVCECVWAGVCTSLCECV